MGTSNNSNILIILFMFGYFRVSEFQSPPCACTERSLGGVGGERVQGLKVYRKSNYFVGNRQLAVGKRRMPHTASRHAFFFSLKFIPLCSLKRARMLPSVSCICLAERYSEILSKHAGFLSISLSQHNRCATFRSVL